MERNAMPKFSNMNKKRNLSNSFHGKTVLRDSNYSNYGSVNTDSFQCNRVASFSSNKKFKSSNHGQKWWPTYGNSRSSYKFWNPTDYETQPNCSLKGQNNSVDGVCDQDLQVSVIVDQPLPIDLKISRLISAVRSQAGIKGQLVLLQSRMDNSMSVLRNGLHTINASLFIFAKYRSTYELLINGQKFAEGCYSNKVIATEQLSSIVVNDLKKSCFYVIKKNHCDCEEVSTTDELHKKAHVMLKMGQKGESMGAHEQGETKSIIEELTVKQNIVKEGENMMAEINRVLKKFVDSTDVTILIFNSSLTKEERAHIHSISLQYNLKSKSERKSENRRVTITKKINKWELVRELLLAGGENDNFKLIVPFYFEDMWLNK